MISPSYVDGLELRVKELSDKLAAAREEIEIHKTWASADAGWARVRELEAENAALRKVVDAVRKLVKFGWVRSGKGIYDALRALDAGKDLPENSKKIYPCVDCGKMRSKDEGGTVFTVCEICWDKRHKKPLDAGKEDV